MKTNSNTETIAAHVLSRLARVAIDQDPFPHVVLRDAFPDEYFRYVLARLPSAAFFAAAEYPGTGRFTVRHGGTPTAAQNAHHHGLVLRDWSTVPALGAADALFRSEAFAQALLDRFSHPSSRGGTPAIPRSKHHLFNGPNRQYECVFALYKDLGGYEISPHVDHAAKLVTFLWYVHDESSSSAGTLLCKAKPGVDVAALIAAGYESALAEGRSGLWLDWDKFEVVKEVSGRNVLFAFAPNDISLHGVRLPVMSGAKQERTVVRGFVARKGYCDTVLIDTAQSQPTV